MEILTNETQSRWNYTDCKRASEISGCQLPEKEFTASEEKYIREKFGIIGIGLRILKWCNAYWCIDQFKGPHSRNPRLRDPTGEICFMDCWYFEYHIDQSCASTFHIKLYLILPY